MRPLRIGADERLLFISDLHLCETRPACAAAFFDFLGGQARRASRLFILGDLFEFWAGDDDESAFAGTVTEALRALVANGTRCHFMRGNRDFLLGEGYARRAGLDLLEEPQLLELPSQRLLLMHGDTLCTDDLPYQAFRAQVRTPAWQAAFLALPLAQRRAMIRGAREQSESAKQGKQAAIMDASDEAIASVLRAHACPTLIHGHTHRCARHYHELDGQACERWVLADWHDRARCLEWHAGALAFADGPPPGG